MPTEDPHEHAHDDILPEIVVDESAEQYVQQPEEEDEPPLPAPAEAEEHLQNEVVIEPELPPAPEQDNIFQTGKPVKKKRNVSEKQRAHLERIRTKALERKKEKAAERKAARATSQPAPGEDTAPADTTPAPAPRVEPVPSPYLTHEDVDAILSRYEERRAKKKEAKRKEAQAQELVRTHMQQDDVWAQCFQ